MHPCPWERGRRDRRGRGPRRRGHTASRGGRGRRSLARRLSGSGAPGCSPGSGRGGAGRGRGRQAPLSPPPAPPLLSPLAPGPAAPTAEPAAGKGKARTAPAASAALRQAVWQTRRGGDPRRADSGSAGAAWAARCTGVPRRGEHRRSCTPRGSCGSSPSARRLNPLQMKAAVGGLLLPGFGKPQMGTCRGGSQPPRKQTGWQPPGAQARVTRRFPLGRKKFRRRRVSRGTLAAPNR